jgi:diguanylate cyclase (GGDEF)-like protein/PAS domain S-box-containing protein
MRGNKTKLFFVIQLLVLTISGSIYLLYIWNSGIKDIEDEALRLAMTAEATLRIEGFHNLKAEEFDKNRPEYWQIKQSLIKIVSINTNVRFAYIYKEKDGKIYYMADSEPESSIYYSAPGQELVEADGTFFLALKQYKPIITKPTKDRRGNWVSILVPVRDNSTGNVIAVFGMGYAAKNWNRDLMLNLTLNGVIVISAFLLINMFYIIMVKNRALGGEKKKLALLNVRLVEQEGLFRAIYEQSPLGLTFGDFESNVINANKMYEKIVGWSREELAEKGWMAITHPEDLPMDMEMFNKFKNNDINGYTMVKRFIRPDQSIVWTNMTIAAIQLVDKDNPSYLCIVEDITEKKRAEDDLQESERSKSMLLSNLPGIAYRSDYNNVTNKWNMVFISEGCYKLTGYRPEDLLSHEKNNKTFSSIIKPEYRQYIKDKWNETIQKKAIFNEEYPIVTVNGEIRWVFEKGQGVYNNGQIEAAEGIVIDITGIKKREEEINYLNNHDTLSGIYNRRFFESEKLRIDQESSYPLTVVIGDINGLKLINDSLGHSEGDKLIITIAKILQSCCKETDILARTGGDEFSILMPNTSSEEAEQIIKRVSELCEEYKRTSNDEAYHISISLGLATKIQSEEILNNIIKDAEDSMYRHKMLQNRSLHSSIISSMKSTLFEKSQETEEHAQRLIELSNMLGRKMKLSDKQLNELELLSTLHDIGKIGISDTILNKPDKLTEEEWVEMKKHPEIGYRIAMSTPELAPIAEFILCHHERWDGFGYPQKLTGTEIPLLSRIISIVDSYDAMTSDRIYRKGFSKQNALEEIKRNSGTQFDPELTELFLEEMSI